MLSRVRGLLCLFLLTPLAAAPQQPLSPKAPSQTAQPAAPAATPPGATSTAKSPPAVAPPKPAAAKPPVKKKAVDRRLTLEQISNLLAGRMQDRLLSREIKSRGLKEDLNRAAIERFRTQGAGPETLAVLTQLVPKSSLLIQSEPGVAVFLDDQPAGATDARGTLKLDPLDPGPHQVRATKEFRRDFSQTITLHANKQEMVTASMPWVIGYITIDPKQPEAQIVVSGAGSHVGVVQRLPVSVGEHTITVSLPLRKTVRTTVNIRGGENLTIPVRLDLDPAAIQGLRDAITKSCAAKDYDTAERQIQDFQRFDSLDSPMQTCLSIAYLKHHQYDEFVKMATKAMAQGGDFTFPVVHIHGSRRRGAHDALLTISQTEVHYEPKGKCNLATFSRLRKEAEWSEHAVPDGAELTLILPEAEAKKKLVMTFFDEDKDRLLVIYRLATESSPAAATKK